MLTVRSLYEDRADSLMLGAGQGLAIFQLNTSSPATALALLLVCCAAQAFAQSSGGAYTIQAGNSSGCTTIKSYTVTVAGESLQAPPFMETAKILRRRLKSLFETAKSITSFPRRISSWDVHF